MADRFPAYSGDGPYVFISYSHKDSHVVYPIIERLAELGYNIWYDEGIPLVADYGGVLYEKITQCSLFVLFVSRASVKSKDVEKEAAHAISFNKDIAQIVIDEDAKLPPSIAYHLPKTRQYLVIDTDSKEFWRHLCATLSPCRESGAAAPTGEAFDRIVREEQEEPRLLIDYDPVKLTADEADIEKPPSTPNEYTVWSEDGYNAIVRRKVPPPPPMGPSSRRAALLRKTSGKTEAKAHPLTARIIDEEARHEETDSSTIWDLLRTFGIAVLCAFAAILLIGLLLNMSYCFPGGI